MSQNEKKYHLLMINIMFIVEAGFLLQQRCSSEFLNTHMHTHMHTHTHTHTGLQAQSTFKFFEATHTLRIFISIELQRVKI